MFTFRGFDVLDIVSHPFRILLQEALRAPRSIELHQSQDLVVRGNWRRSYHQISESICWIVVVTKSPDITGDLRDRKNRTSISRVSGGWHFDWSCGGSVSLLSQYPSSLWSYREITGGDYWMLQVGLHPSITISTSTTTTTTTTTTTIRSPNVFELGINFCSWQSSNGSWTSIHIEHSFLGVT